jgi:hypothetical protein
LNILSLLEAAGVVAMLVEAAGLEVCLLAQVSPCYLGLLTQSRLEVAALRRIIVLGPKDRRLCFQQLLLLVVAVVLQTAGLELLFQVGMVVLVEGQEIPQGELAILHLHRHHKEIMAGQPPLAQTPLLAAAGQVRREKLLLIMFAVETGVQVPRLQLLVPQLPTQAVVVEVVTALAGIRAVQEVLEGAETDLRQGQQRKEQTV